MGKIYLIQIEFGCLMQIFFELAKVKKISQPNSKLEIQAMSHKVLKTNRSFHQNFECAADCGSFLSLQGAMISKAMLLSCLVASNFHLYVNNDLTTRTIQFC